MESATAYGLVTGELVRVLAGRCLYWALVPPTAPTASAVVDAAGTTLGQLGRSE